MQYRRREVITAVSSGVVVKPDAPWQTWQEFVDYAKKNPGKVNTPPPVRDRPGTYRWKLQRKRKGLNGFIFFTKVFFYAGGLWKVYWRKSEHRTSNIESFKGGQVMNGKR